MDDQSFLDRALHQEHREYSACFRCTKECFSSHALTASNREELTTAPSFLKIVTQNFNRLETPQGFASEHLIDYSGEVQIEGPSGWIWHANLSQADDGRLCLGNPGWDDFVHDHNIECSDIVVFSMIGKTYFKAKIFDANSGVEKGHECLPTKPKEVSLPNCVVQTEYCARESSILNDSVHEICDNDSETDMSETETEEWLPNKSSCKDLSEDDNEIQMVKTSQNLHSKSRLKNTRKSKGESRQTRNAKGESRQTRKAKSDIDPEQKAAERRDRRREQVMLEKANDPILNWYLAREDTEYDPYAKATAIEKERVANKAQAFHSKHPFAVKVLTASSVHKCKKLVLPCIFSRGYMPTTDEILIWVDPCGKEWKCKWIGKPTYNRGHPFVSAGWPGFARAHRLIENDICIIEFIDRKAYRFRVHILKQRLTHPQPQ